MRTQNRTTHVLVCGLITFLVAALVVCSSPSLYAKGSSRNQSQGDSGDRSSNSSQDNQIVTRGADNRSDSGRVSRSEESSQPKHQQRSEPKVDSPPPPPPPSPVQNRSNEEQRGNVNRNQQHDNSKSISNRRADNHSSSEEKGVPKHGQSQTQNGWQQPEGTRNVSSDSPDNQNRVYRNGGTNPQQPEGARNVSNDSPDNQNRVYRNGGTNPQQKVGNSGAQPSNGSRSSNDSELRGGRSDSTLGRTISATGVYRKDYADLADIWKNRRERRDDNQRYGSSSGYNNHSRPNVHVNIFPGSCYGYYQYDYNPWYSYPSVYCYYYGLFPPYIHSRRVVIIRHEYISYTYLEIPLTTIFHEDTGYSSGRDNYYLANYRTQDLGPTLRAVERAWEKGEPQLLYDHIRRGSTIDVYLRGDYSYTLDAQDYQDMTSDAMLHIRTQSFDFYKVRQRSHGVVVAYGKHTYYDQDSYDSDQEWQFHGTRTKSDSWKTTYVTYTFERTGGQWYVTEAGSSTDRL